MTRRFHSKRAIINARVADRCAGRRPTADCQECSAGSRRCAARGRGEAACCVVGSACSAGGLTREAEAERGVMMWAHSPSMRLPGGPARIVTTDAADGRTPAPSPRSTSSRNALKCYCASCWIAAFILKMPFPGDFSAPFSCGARARRETLCVRITMPSGNSFHARGVAWQVTRCIGHIQQQRAGRGWARTWGGGQ